VVEGFGLGRRSLQRSHSKGRPGAERVRLEAEFPGRRKLGLLGLPGRAFFQVNLIGASTAPMLPATLENANAADLNVACRCRAAVKRGGGAIALGDEIVVLNENRTAPALDCLGGRTHSSFIDFDENDSVMKK
jgi:hypothetical protein